MDIQNIVQKIKAAKGPDRAIDREIAKLVTQLALSGRIDGQASPHANAPPLYFTRDLDAAYILSKMLVPHGKGGVSWEPDRAGAVLTHEAEFVEAQTAPLALCLASIMMIENLA